MHVVYISIIQISVVRETKEDIYEFELFSGNLGTRSNTIMGAQIKRLFGL
ncbi:MAG: hypothetical protein ACOYIF_03435 [Acetivibrionales bacterium]